MAADPCDLQKKKEERISNYVLIYEMDRRMQPDLKKGRKPIAS